jgi:hypothetical protein
VTPNTGTGSNAVHERVPRNAPHVFNLGAKEFALMFHDGRVAVDPSRPSGFESPAGDALDFVVQDDPALRAPIADAYELGPRRLNDRQVVQLIAFLRGMIFIAGTRESLSSRPA